MRPEIPESVALSLTSLTESEPATRDVAKRKQPTSVLRSLGRLLAFAGVSGLTAAVGALVNVQPKNRLWYRAIRKSTLTPPDRVFGIVWPALYTMSAVSVWRTSNAPPSSARSMALGLWGTQLAFNAAWTPIFFGAHRPRLALADLAATAASVAGYVRFAQRVDRRAARLMWPYLGWLGFAAILNTAAVRRNRGLTRWLVND
ncbi:MAG TPA: TspO/MBR family protein [Polyangiaceae bacterium]|nr:TspO/MBR family protein [Polyangiaceae bacterium]